MALCVTLEVFGLVFDFYRLDRKLVRTNPMLHSDNCFVITLHMWNLLDSQFAMQMYMHTLHQVDVTCYTRGGFVCYTLKWNI